MTSEKNWDFDCPQFVDLSSLPTEETDVESYFGMDHEKHLGSGFKVISMSKTNVSPFRFEGTKESRRSSKRKQIRFSMRLQAAQEENPLPTQDSPQKKRPKLLQPVVPLPVPPSIVKELVKRKREEVVSQQRPKVKPFRFASRNNSVSTCSSSGDVYKEVDFKATLRSNAATSKSVQGKLTRVAPFHLTENRKRKLEVSTPYVPLAERVMRFQNQTPQRFRPVLKPNSEPSGIDKSLQCTRPAGPNLHTTRRNRPLTTESQKEKEEKELQDIKNYRFKAQPFDPKIFIHTMGIPQVKSTSATKPMDIKLNIEKRIEARPKKVEEPKYEFHARPAPKKIFEEVSGLPVKTQSRFLKAITPDFIKRRQDQSKSNETVTSVTSTKSGIMRKKLFGHFGGSAPTPRSLVPVVLKPTRPVPFSFHDRDQTKMAKKEEKIQKEIDEEAKVYEFRARPMPSPTCDGLPAKKVKPNTIVKPFSLLIERRGEIMADKWQKQVEEDLKQQKAAAIFKAQPNETVFKPAFVPAKCVKPPTQTSGFELNTVSRAEERKKYEQSRKSREKDFEAEKELKELEEAEALRQELAEMRAARVHKAKPVLHSAPFSIKPSLKPATIPKTPKFQTDARIGKSNKENRLGRE